MVQIIRDNRKPTGLEKFGELLSSGLRGTAQGGQSLMNSINARKERGALAERFGDEFKDVRDPQARSQMLQGALQKENQQSKFANEYEADEESFNKIKEAFGEKFAKIWRSSPQGARTELTKAALDARSRGIDLDKLIGEQTQNDMPSETNAPKTNSEYKLNTEGMTPKETVQYKSSLRKENLPIWQESIKKSKNYRELDRDINTLENLNERKNLPEGLSKLLINPETGAPYELVTAVKNMHPDVQQFVKTIARQATQARESFPGRVTNFDLQKYMQQFPSLFNTYEGRKIILDQMGLVNKAHTVFENALSEVYNKHKLSGITPEDAEDMAEKSVKNELDEINSKISNLASNGEQLAKSSNELSGKMVDVIGPDGNIYEVDESEVEALPEGYRVK